MALPSSGVMKASMIQAELKETGSWSINAPTSRKLAKVPTGTIKFSDFYGKSAENSITFWLRNIVDWGLYYGWGGDKLVLETEDGKVPRVSICGHEFDLVKSNAYADETSDNFAFSCDRDIDINNVNYGVKIECTLPSGEVLKTGVVKWNHIYDSTNHSYGTHGVITGTSFMFGAPWDETAEDKNGYEKFQKAVNSATDWDHRIDLKFKVTIYEYLVFIVNKLFRGWF